MEESRAVDIVLKPGQTSLHHGHLFQASGPNTTGDRRIGAALRCIKPSMKARSGQATQVSLVAGEDRYGHFTITPGPMEPLAETDFQAV